MVARVKSSKRFSGFTRSITAWWERWPASAPVATGALAGHRSHQAVMLRVKPEKRFEDLTRATMRPAHCWVVIEVLVKKIPQFKVQFAASGTVTHERSGLEPDLIRAAHAGLVD